MWPRRPIPAVQQCPVRGSCHQHGQGLSLDHGSQDLDSWALGGQFKSQVSNPAVLLPCKTTSCFPRLPALRQHASPFLLNSTDKGCLQLLQHQGMEDPWVFYLPWTSPRPARIWSQNNDHQRAPKSHGSWVWASLALGQHTFCQPQSLPKVSLGRMQLYRAQLQTSSEDKKMHLRQAFSSFETWRKAAPLRKPAGYQAAARPMCGPCVPVKREAPLG